MMSYNMQTELKDKGSDHDTRLLTEKLVLDSMKLGSAVHKLSSLRAQRVIDVLRAIFLARCESAFQLVRNGGLTSRLGIYITQAVLRFEFLISTQLKKQVRTAFSAIRFKAQSRKILSHIDALDVTQQKAVSFNDRKVQGALRLITALNRKQFLSLDKVRAIRKWQLLSFRMDLQNLKKENYHNLHLLKLAILSNLVALIRAAQRRTILEAFRTIEKKTAKNSNEDDYLRVQALQAMMGKIQLYEQPQVQSYVLMKRFFESLKEKKQLIEDEHIASYRATTIMTKYMSRKISYILRAFHRNTKFGPPMFLEKTTTFSSIPKLELSAAVKQPRLQETILLARRVQYHIKNQMSDAFSLIFNYKPDIINDGTAEKLTSLIVILSSANTRAHKHDNIYLQQGFNSIYCNLQEQKKQDELGEFVKVDAMDVISIWMQGKLKNTYTTAFNKLRFYKSSQNQVLRMPKQIVRKDGGSADSRIDKGIIQNMSVVGDYLEKRLKQLERDIIRKRALTVIFKYFNRQHTDAVRTMKSCLDTWRMLSGNCSLKEKLRILQQKKKLELEQRKLNEQLEQLYNEENTGSNPNSQNHTQAIPPKIRMSIGSGLSPALAESIVKNLPANTRLSSDILATSTNNNENPLPPSKNMNHEDLAYEYLDFVEKQHQILKERYKELEDQREEKKNSFFRKKKKLERFLMQINSKAQKEPVNVVKKLTRSKSFESVRIDNINGKMILLSAKNLGGSDTFCFREKFKMLRLDI